MTPRDATAAWEDEGGAVPSGAGTSQDGSEHARHRVDRSHDSTARGEHRYPDAHQTPAERLSRRTRDELKHSLAVPTARYQRP